MAKKVDLSLNVCCNIFIILLFKIFNGDFFQICKKTSYFYRLSIYKALQVSQLSLDDRRSPNQIIQKNLCRLLFLDCFENFVACFLDFWAHIAIYYLHIGIWMRWEFTIVAHVNIFALLNQVTDIGPFSQSSLLTVVKSIHFDSISIITSIWLMKYQLWKYYKIY